MSGIDTSHTDKRCDDLERRLDALERPSEGRQGPVTDWQWLAEDRSKSIEALCRVTEDLTKERDEMRSAHEKLRAGYINQIDSVTAERDAARDLLTDAEHTRDMALARIDEVEHERDALQKSMDFHHDDLRIAERSRDGWREDCEREAKNVAHLQSRLDALATRAAQVVLDRTPDYYLGDPQEPLVSQLKVAAAIRDALLADAPTPPAATEASAEAVPQYCNSREDWLTSCNRGTHGCGIVHEKQP